MSIKERDVTKPIQEENASQENRWEYAVANSGDSAISAFLPAAFALLALALHRILSMNAQFMEKPLLYYTLFMGASASSSHAAGLTGTASTTTDASVADDSSSVESLGHDARHRSSC